MPKFATRPIFIPQKSAMGYFSQMDVTFEYHSGFAHIQKQKSIHSLHETSKLASVLEVSTKSGELFGLELSAFNLTFEGRPIECLFQGSKCFSGGGPYGDIYNFTPIQAKKDPRIKNSGQITGFYFKGELWELTPQSAFYDWLYLNALATKKSYFYKKLKAYDGFSDIEFNPKKSISTQSRSCALFVSLCNDGLFETALQNPNEFIKTAYMIKKEQPTLF